MFDFILYYFCKWFDKEELMAHRYGYARREAIKAQKAAQDAKFLEDNADYIKQIVDTVKANSNIAAGRFAVVIRDSKTTLNEMIQSDVNAYVSDIMEGKEKPEDRLSFCGIQNIYDSRKAILQLQQLRKLQSSTQRQRKALSTSSKTYLFGNVNIICEI